MNKIWIWLFDADARRQWPLDISLLLVRLVFGLSMAFAHGHRKVPPSEGFIDKVGEMGFFAPAFFAWAAGLSEFLGGVLIAVGFLVRPSALFLLITMLVAVLVAHAGDPFKKIEMGLLYASVAFALTATGAGRLSIDHWLSSKFSKN